MQSFFYFFNLEFIALNLKNFPDKDHNCVLSLDEVQVRKCVQFDKGLNSFICYVSKEIYPEQLNDPAHHGYSCTCFHDSRYQHAVETSDRYPITCFFTADSVTEPTLWSLVKKTIILLGDKNMHVRAVCQ